MLLKSTHKLMLLGQPTKTYEYSLTYAASYSRVVMGCLVIFMYKYGNRNQFMQYVCIHVVHTTLDNWLTLQFDDSVGQN